MAVRTKETEGERREKEHLLRLVFFGCADEDVAEAAPVARLLWLALRPRGLSKWIGSKP